MTPDQRRILETRSNPAILRFWWALQPLKSAVRFMNTGAHPDDETSAMLAALGVRDGINLSYACSTRGEGGQNDIGTDAGADLGALRTAEMERAAEALGMRLYWLSESPEDSITDFGFSKSGEETLGKWGRESTLRRFVEIVRKDRPDVLCPTFLDVPGQHGHHRAMTALAHEVFEVAADPGYVTEGLAPWSVSKLYLPAWSGAGQSYDDDLPPPPATLTVPGHDFDPVSGWGWGMIGEQSRVFHRTQAMGRWASTKVRKDWDLHLAARRTQGDDITVASGLPATLAGLALLDGAEGIANDMHAAQQAMDEAFDAFPSFPAVAECLVDALESVRIAARDCPAGLVAGIAHRLTDKERQLSRALRLALRIEAGAVPEKRGVLRGGRCAVALEADCGQAGEVEVTLVPEDGWTAEADGLAVTGKASLPSGYRSEFDPLVPPAPALRIRARLQGTEFEDRISLDDAPVALPDRVVELVETRAVLNLRAGARDLAVGITGVVPKAGTVGAGLPPGWTAQTDGAELRVSIPSDVEPGCYELPILVDGQQAYSVRHIHHGHTRPVTRAFPARLTVRVLSVEVPDVRVGYIGGGNDRVAHWLNAIGADVTELAGSDLDADALAEFDSIVIGIFAMKFAPGLAESLTALHDRTRAGGTLVTLYHRPWDNWDPERTPPLKLEIGQPSLRWRVTDENAAVSHLVSGHPVLNVPNRIGSETWSEWKKERGLYFAKAWDPAYAPLIEMADPGEDPHRGALLAADVGEGRHIHTSLVLHHQMEQLVPGGFELMCNLIARRE